MKKFIVTILKYLLLFAVIYGAVNWWRSPSLPDTPSLVYQNLDGTPTDVIAQSHDTPILVYFWGTWCSVCRLSTPNIEQLHNDGTPVVSVAVRSDSTDDLANYLSHHHYTFITINDLDGKIFGAWQGKVTPSFVIIKDGKIHQSFTGIAPLWTLQLRLWLANML